MTDQEKAEEYMLQNVEEREYGDGYFLEPLTSIKQAYLDGLAEGRKGNEQLYKTLDHLREGEVARFECWNNRLTELEKENAELKEELRQKSDTNHSLVEQLADKEIIISELKEQIEKMKCCGNCKHWIVKLGFDSKCELKEPCEFGKRDKWELAE